METAGEAVNQASDSRHNFFVTVLEKVRESLKPLTKSNALDLSSIKNATPRAGGDRARQSELRNLFEVLDVYEPSAEFLAAPDVVPSPSPVELEYTVEEPTDSIIEAFMAMTMLVNDLSRLRAEIADLWARHNTGPVFANKLVLMRSRHNRRPTQMIITFKFTTSQMRFSSIPVMPFWSFSPTSSRQS